MTPEAEVWAPGSFTKNFSWGRGGNGLAELHQAIRIGFAERIESTPRSEFRRRVAQIGRPDLVPINFFLFNKPIAGEDYLVVDELVFQAVTTDYSDRFDKLALFAFLFSYVGVWAGASSEQRRPALWANRYVAQRVGLDFDWETRDINADDIQKFVGSSPYYRGATSRKLATNLNFLLAQGGLKEFSEDRVERWWTDAVFLALDRLIEDRSLGREVIPEGRVAEILATSDFQTIAGRPSLEKRLAIPHLVMLYNACGGRERFSESSVQARTQVTLPDIVWYVANDPRPRGAVHPTNPAILKSIPMICALLAQHVAGFDVIAPDEMANFDVEDYVRRRTAAALETLQQLGATPTMTAEELLRMTRER